METIPFLVGSSPFQVVATFLLLVMAFVGIKIWTWVWLRPKSIEKKLKEQGLVGSPYKFLHGDLKDTLKKFKEAQAKPMPSNPNDIAPRMVPYYLDMKNTHGNIFYMWKGPTARVVIMNPELAKEVISNKFGHFGKPEVSGLMKLLVTGLLSYNGEKWSKHRKIINPSFHHEKLKMMLPAFTTSCTALIDKWGKLLGTNENVELDVFKEFDNLAGDVISRTAFGSSYEEGSRMFQLLKEEALLLIQILGYSFIPGYRFLPTKINRRVKEIDREVREILFGIIDKREKEMRAGVHSEDLLGFLLESNMRELEENGNNKKGVLTREEVIEECKLFYFAGQDTTGSLLTWTAILLGMNPSWQDRAREEVFQVFRTNKPHFDGLGQLKIVTMILYESLRLYPPVSFITRCTEKETRVGQFILPARTEVFISTILMHHDPEFWGPDVLEFNPERFTEGVLKASRNGKAFYAFGGGPRICIGQNFAFVEAKLALAMILQHFSFELSSSYIHAPSAIMTLQPKNGAQVIMRRLS